MKIIKIALILPVVGAFAACAPIGPDKSRDRGIIGSKSLSQLQAGVWIDPEGCDHWIIDDGVEGYLSPRVDKYGKPVCSGTAPPNTATGNFKGGGDIADSL